MLRAFYNKNMETKFTDTEQYQYGELEYEYSNAKTMHDAPMRNKTSGAKILSKIYTWLVALGLLGWFLYSFITQVNAEGFQTAIESHGFGIIILVIAELIIILSVFGLWGKAGRFATRNKVTTFFLARSRPSATRDIRRLREEFNIADELATHENAVYVYTNYIVLFHDGVKTVLDRARLRKVTVETFDKSMPRMLLCFIFNERGIGPGKSYSILVPNTDLVALRKVFADKLEFVEQEQSTDSKRNVAPFFVFGAMMLIGIAMIVVRLAVLAENLLLFIGLFFLLAGAISIVGQFKKPTVMDATIKEGFFKIIVAVVLVGFPLLMMWIISQVEDIPLTIEGFFGTFSYNVIFVFMMSLAPLALIEGVAAIVEAIRYRR